MKNIIPTVIVVLALSSCSAPEAPTTDPTITHDTVADIHENAGFKVVGIADGMSLSSPVKISMLSKGLSVVGPGEVKKNEGYYHILINRNFVKQGEAMPKESEVSIPLRNGETEISLDLNPGRTVIGIQFVDGNELSYGQTLFQGFKVMIED